MGNSLLIQGGRVIDPANKVDREADLLVVDGRISRVAKGVAKADRTIDARGKWVVPGLVDIHVHLRDPGFEYKEDIASGTAAAAAGGVTSVCCMPNTRPINDCRAVTEYIVNRAREQGKVRVFPFGAMTIGQEGKELCEYSDMKDAGVVGLSDDGVCVMNSGVMRRVMEYARTFDLPLVQHCEDHTLSGDGVVHEGEVSTRLGLAGQAPQCEAIMVGRDLQLVELTGARYHACHLSTKQSLAHMRHGKALGLPASCEVMPHHFLLTDEACLKYDTMAKVNPPLRSREHVDAVREALADGTVDVIATDHAPHAFQEKEVEFGLAAFGISGLETLVPLALTLVRDDVVNASRLIELMTCNPAKVIGLKAGTLSPGADADVTVIDPGLAWTVDPQRFQSKGKNTPFAGLEVTGAATHTIVAGNIVYERELAVG